MNLNTIRSFSKTGFWNLSWSSNFIINFGASTEKMHHGHRGANHPIKNINSKKVEITVQNHGFVVSKNNFPKNLKISHISLFDETIAGVEVKNKPFFSVQYHQNHHQDHRIVVISLINLNY